MRLILFLLLISSWGSYAQDIDYNTTIVVNLKNPADKIFVKTFAEYRPYGLGPLHDTPPPFKVISDTPLKTHLKVKLSYPSCLALGFSYIFISPGDSLNFDYETLVNTYQVVKDTIIINHGNVSFSLLKYEQASGRFLRALIEKIQNIRDSSSINEYLSEENLVNLIAQYKEIIYNQWPNLNKDKETKESINQLAINRVYREIFYAINGYLNDSNKNIIDDMLKYASENDNQQYSYNWERYLSIYRFFKIKEKNDASKIISKFENCNEIIKQYILLNLLKDELIDETQVLNKITYPPYKKFEEKIIQDLKRTVKLPPSISKAEVYDASDNKYTLEEVFENSSQPYLLFDFCGTWCKPCIEEIAKYSKNRHLDNSKNVKPIWLFFENDKSKWIGTIAKYRLKENNCFIITGSLSKDLIKEFSIHTGWQGEFPHYFLFRKDGKMINADAESLSKFSESSLPKP